LQTIGVICEYNPFHLGHMKQLAAIRHEFGPDSIIVCLMSGNFVQRGQPAIFDKMRRAEAALSCGADLVLELPVQYALSSAEGFAAGGVSILSRLCDTLCFGAETADRQLLMDTARALLSDRFPSALRAHLDAGLSFPAARQAALTDLELDGTVLETPNNILAVEYCKAILSQNASMNIFPIGRKGSYHDTVADAQEPSATAVRQLIAAQEDWQRYVPEKAHNAFRNATVHLPALGETAILSRLRTMTDAEFEALPYGSEGLWRKLMHECRRQATLEEILTAVKSKRYTRSRLDRMVMCAYLGLTAADLDTTPPYIRVLAFSDAGRGILSRQRESGFLRNIGEDTRCDHQQLERRCTALYGLFARQPEAPNAEDAYRVIHR
jgi:predicted nucleotidyltransferase